MTKNPDVALTKEVYEAEVARIRSGEITRLAAADHETAKAILHRHILKAIWGKQYDKIISRSALRVIKQKVKDGDLDGLALEELAKNGFLHVEQVKRDKLSGLHIYDRGLLVVADHYLPRDDQVRHIARSIYSIFKDTSARKRAGQAQQFFHELADYARANTGSRTAHEVLKQLRTIEPTYNKGQILGNLFLAQAEDMQETLRSAPIEERYAHLQASSRIDVVLAHYAKDAVRTRRGQKLTRELPTIEHRKVLYEKVILRADPTAKNRSQEEW